jgi:5-formyltetrahydrofolate cyclo-ligase
LRNYIDLIERKDCVSRAALSKQDLRKSLKAERASLSSAEAADASRRIVRQALGILPFADCSTIALYWPIGNEVDPRRIASSEAMNDHRFCLPVTGKIGEALRFREWAPGDPTLKARFGEEVPEQGSWVEPQLLFVPLLGFDRRGYRLGQGGGFYDRTLESLRARRTILAVGLAFSSQECLNVPHEPHDQVLDRVVTEMEVITF